MSNHKDFLILLIQFISKLEEVYIVYQVSHCVRCALTDLDHKRSTVSMSRFLCNLHCFTDIHSKVNWPSCGVSMFP